MRDTGRRERGGVHPLVGRGKGGDGGEERLREGSREGAGQRWMGGGQRDGGREKRERGGGGGKRRERWWGKVKKRMKTRGERKESEVVER